MNTKMLAAGLLLILFVSTELRAQSALPTTVVLTTLTIKKGVEQADIQKILPEEVRATVKLYLSGKIQQWYGRSDGKGVVFIMNCNTVEQAKSVTATLPLSKANLADFEYTALGPLGPLHLLVDEPAKGSQ